MSPFVKNVLGKSNQVWVQVTIQATAAGLLGGPDEPCSVIGWVQNSMGIVEVTEMKLLIVCSLNHTHWFCQDIKDENLLRRKINPLSLNAVKVFRDIFNIAMLDNTKGNHLYSHISVVHFGHK